MDSRFTPLFLLVLSVQISVGQGPTIFTRKDFDLNGMVKSCTVITDYGKEHFEFEKEGLLAKTVTQYNENDQDIVRYLYKGGMLVEKRMESYKNGVLDPMTSMVNFYVLDTLQQPKRLLEKTASYDKEFLEKQEYILDEDDNVVKVTISNQEGVDEKRIERTDYKNESTQTFFTNEVIERSIRTSKSKNKTGKEIITVLTKEYVDGQPNTATEKKMFANGRLLSEEEFVYDVDEGQYATQVLITYIYNAQNVLEKEIIKRGNAVSEKGYFFQFDSNEPKNWVKKITTPDNSYITRKIEYFKKEVALEQIKG